MMSRAGEAQNPGLDQTVYTLFVLYSFFLDKGLHAGDGTA
jgi:hypothetical protein